GCEQSAGIRDASDCIPLRTTRRVPEQQLRVVVDALAIHRRDHAGEWRRKQARDLDGAGGSSPELDSTVNSYAARDQRISEGAGGKARRIFDDVNVFTGSGTRADRAIRRDRPIALLPESESGAAPGDGSNVGDEGNRAGRGLEYDRCRLSWRRRAHRDRDKILVELER